MQAAERTCKLRRACFRLHRWLSPGAEPKKCGPASSPEEYVEALAELANSPELRARLGASGRRTVEQDYSARAVAAKFAAVVRKATGGPSAIR